MGQNPIEVYLLPRKSLGLCASFKGLNTPGNSLFITHFADQILHFPAVTGRIFFNFAIKTRSTLEVSRVLRPLWVLSKIVRSRFLIFLCKEEKTGVLCFLIFFLCHKSFVSAKGKVVSTWPWRFKHPTSTHSTHDSIFPSHLPTFTQKKKKFVFWGNFSSRWLQNRKRLSGKVVLAAIPLKGQKKKIFLSKNSFVGFEKSKYTFCDNR